MTPIGTPIDTRNAPALGHGKGPLGGIDREKARRVAFGLLELSPGLTPGDIEIKDLIDDGRP